MLGSGAACLQGRQEIHTPITSAQRAPRQRPNSSKEHPSPSTSKNERKTPRPNHGESLLKSPIKKGQKPARATRTLPGAEKDHWGSGSAPRALKACRSTTKDSIENTRTQPWGVPMRTCIQKRHKPVLATRGPSRAPKRCMGVRGAHRAP